MAAKNAPEKEIREDHEHSDLHKGTIHKSSHQEPSPEEVCGPGDDPFLSSPSQSRSADGFPGLLGSDRKCGQGSTLASDFWSQGVANWRALNSRSTGNEKTSDSTVFIEELGNPSARKDDPNSARTQSRGKLDRSRILASWPSGGASVPSSVKDRLARPTPDAAASGLHDTPEHKKPALPSAQENPATLLASGIKACDRSSGAHVQKNRSTTSESVLDCPKMPRGGNEPDSLMGPDAVSLHVQRARDKTTSHAEIADEFLGLSTTAKTQPARSTCASRPENRDELPGLLATEKSKPTRNTTKPNQDIEDDLLGLPTTTKTRPATPRGSTPGSGAHSSLGGASFHQQGRNLYIPREPKAMRKSKESFDAKNGPHSSIHRSSTPFTHTRSAKVRHAKSLSAETPAFQPDPPAHSTATPTRSYSNGHGKSASTGTGCADPASVSSLPYRQRRLWQYRPNSTGTPPAPAESGAFRNTGEAQPSIGFRYPEPHQHTPEGQGQFFGTQGSITPLIPPQLYGPLDPILHSLHSSLPVFHNDMFSYTAQIDKQGDQNAEYSQSNHFDSYTTAQAPNAASNAADIQQNGNLYTQDTNGYGPRYYSNHADPSHQVSSCAHRVGHTVLRKLQLNQNLYSPLEPHREPSKPNQRTSKDMFIPEDIRLKLHAKTEATLRVFAGKSPVDWDSGLSCCGRWLIEPF